MLRGQASRLTLVATAALLAACARSSLAELERLYAADRADRAGPVRSYSELEARDAERCRRAAELHEAGRVRAPREKLLASALLQHGGEPRHLLLSRELAIAAAEGGIPEARWLAAAAQDLHRISQGRPQLYGTQLLRDPADGRWGLGEVDPALTDQERSSWGVRPLAESRRLAEELNREGLAAFTRDRERARVEALLELRRSSGAPQALQGPRSPAEGTASSSTAAALPVEESPPAAEVSRP